MNQSFFSPKLVAIVGGSGSGKSWLVEKLQAVFPGQSAAVSLDCFYKDQSHVPTELRGALNFDHPQAIDWPAVEQFFDQCRRGKPGLMPGYDFATHTRQPGRYLMLRPLLLVDGLWLLHRPEIRQLFDLKVFVDCPADLRLERRIARDTAKRGRTLESVRQQFDQWVAPMHSQFVEPQKHWADVVLVPPVDQAEIDWLAQRLLELLLGRNSSDGLSGAEEALGSSCLVEEVV